MTFAEQYVKLYDKFYEDKKYGEELINLESALSQTGMTLKGKNILEIGCGSGNFTQLLASMAEVTGVDVSEEMIRQAKLKFPELSSKLHCFSIGELLEKYRKDSFEVVILLFHVFSYLSQNEMLLLKELTKKFLVSGGLFIFDYWDLSAVDMHRPRSTLKKINFEGKTFLRLATTKSMSRNDKSEEFEVKFDFYLEESQKQNLVFTEEHLMRSYFSRDLDIQFNHLECVKNWDIVEGEPFQGKNYGNTKILIKR